MPRAISRASISLRVRGCTPASRLFLGCAGHPHGLFPQVRGVVRTLGYTRTVDCTKGEGEAIRAAVMAGFDARILRAEAAAALARGLEKLGVYEAALKSVMMKRLARKGKFS